MNNLPKSRSCVTGLTIALSKCDPISNVEKISIDDPDFSNWFKENIISDSMELAWNLCVNIIQRKTEDALVCFAILWLKKSKLNEKTSIDSQHDTIQLIWDCLSYFFVDKSDLECYKYFYNWLENQNIIENDTSKRYIMLIPVCAMLRALKFYEEEINTSCAKGKINQLLKKAKKT